MSSLQKFSTALRRIPIPSLATTTKCTERVWRKWQATRALEQVSSAAKPETMLARYRKLIEGQVTFWLSDRGVTALELGIPLEEAKGAVN